MNEKKYNLVQSGDGTKTLYSTEYSETMHSDSGAYQEALYMHVLPSGIMEKNSSRVTVLDLGFGLGYNALASIHQMQKKALPCFIEIISLEKSYDYREFLESIHFTDEKELIYDTIKKAFINGFVSSETFSLKLIIGDAREALQKFQADYFDAVFHDPFSPSKNPELWSVDYFYCLRKTMKESARLTTYSSAPHVRRAMIEAGFTVGPGPSVGRKKEGTIAAVGQNIVPLSTEDVTALYNNVKAIPYRDETLRDSRSVLLERRINEMKKAREGIRADRQAHQG